MRGCSRPEHVRRVFRSFTYHTIIHLSKDIYLIFPSGWIAPHYVLLFILGKLLLTPWNGVHWHLIKCLTMSYNVLQCQNAILCNVLLLIWWLTYFILNLHFSWLHVKYSRLHTLFKWVIWIFTGTCNYKILHGICIWANLSWGKEVPTVLWNKAQYIHCDCSLSFVNYLHLWMCLMCSSTVYWD